MQHKRSKITKQHVKPCSHHKSSIVPFPPVSSHAVWPHSSHSDWSEPLRANEMRSDKKNWDETRRDKTSRDKMRWGNARFVNRTGLYSRHRQTCQCFTVVFSSLTTNCDKHRYKHDAPAISISHATITHTCNASTVHMQQSLYSRVNILLALEKWHIKISAPCHRRPAVDKKSTRPDSDQY